MYLKTYLAWNFPFCIPFWVFTHDHSQKLVYQKAVSIIINLAKIRKKRWAWRVKGWFKVVWKQLQSSKIIQQKYKDLACKAKYFTPCLKQAAKLYINYNHTRDHRFMGRGGAVRVRAAEARVHGAPRSVCVRRRTRASNGLCVWGTVLVRVMACVCEAPYSCE